MSFENLLEKLNKEQLSAVMHQDGPLLIVAGAGTGKTMAVTQRIAYLIEQGRAKPEEILALTFTEKAAGEMEERVDRLLPFGYVELWISTFHSFGERILKAHGLDIGLSNDFKLLNEFEQWMLIKNNLEKFDLDYYKPLGNPTKFIKALLKHFSRCKDEDISPADYLAYAGELRQDLDGMMADVKAQSSKRKAQNHNAKRKTESGQRSDPGIEEQEIARINEIANAYHVYQQLLLDNNALDFGDLINYTLKLFRERPQILDIYRKQFKYIMLDEFQDTNWAQYELIKMLAAPQNNLVVVGDDDQSVYKFRGASVSNILQFRKDYPDAKQIVLTTNYRNRQNILDLSYEFIQHNNPNRLEVQGLECASPPPHSTELTTGPNGYSPQKGETGKRNDGHSPQRGETLKPPPPGRGGAERGGGPSLCKKLKAHKKGKGIIEVLEGRDLGEEVYNVVDKIKEIYNSNDKINWGDFAILVRANTSAGDFCSMLDKEGIPFMYYASRGLYAKPVIMDIVAYLKMLDDYHEGPALYRVLNIPIFDFTYQELVYFNFLANKKAYTLYEVLTKARELGIGPVTQGRISLILNLIHRHTELVRAKSAGEVFLAFLNDSGYLKHLTALEPKEARENLDWLNQFYKRIQTFEAANDDKSVKAFLREFLTELDSGEEGSLTPDVEAGPDAVKVMTIHMAKGLEYKYVFLVGLVDKRFPTIERKDPIEIPEALVKEVLPEGNIHLEEERRLFYVALTRAEEGIYFSWAPDYGGARKKKPSRFLVEAGLTTTKGNTREDELSHKKLERSGRYGAKHPEEVKYELPRYFSFSQLEAFSNCPYQYRFAHILRVPRRGKAQFSFGKTMHSTLQKIFELVRERRGLGQGDLFTPAKKEKNPDIKISEILELYEDSWIDDWYNTKSDKEKFYKKGKEILKEIHGKYNKNWPNANLLEKGFSLKIGNGRDIYTLRGVIDRIDSLSDGKLRIVDYKTGKPKTKLGFNEKKQLLIYQLAVQDVFREEVGSLVFHYLDDNSEFDFLGSDEELEKVKGYVLGTINKISKGVFMANPSKLCNYCDFNKICEFRKLQ